MQLKTISQAPTQAVNENSTPQDIVAWSLDRFAAQNLVLTTSFGMEGCALIDMYARHEKPITVIYLDTMFFFEETYRLRDSMAQKYPHVQFVNRGTTLTPEEQAENFGPQLWKSNPNLCCKLRKVDPMYGALAGADVWVAALRRTQSSTRTNARVVDWDWQYQVLKVCPLVSWERKQVWEYIQANHVPYNELHEKGYPSIGCTHCTQPVPGATVEDYSRAGRWNGTNKTECGLHGYGI